MAWLPWLKENFGSTAQTAENYMAAAKFAAKFKTVLNLKLRPTVLYALGRELYGLDDPDSLYNRKAVEAILKAAESEWINADRAREIAKSLLPPPSPPETAKEIKAEWLAREAERAAAEQAEIDDILDGPPPELPPAPIAAVHDVILPPFDQALAALAQLQTKPLASFAASTHRPDRIRAVIAFLQQVVDAIETPPVADKPEVAAPTSGTEPAVGDSSNPDNLLAEIHAVLKRGTWQHADHGLADRIAIGQLFLAAERGIVTGMGPKPSAPGKKKLWQTKVDNAMRRFIERCKRQDGYYLATLTLKGVKEFFIKEAKAG